MSAVLFMILGFALLIKGADLLVDGAASVARRLRVSELVIGLTVVAFGTSTPELAVNILASIRGNTEIAIGNVLGSNIANVLLILGISALIRPLSVTKGTVWKEIPFSLLAAVVLFFVANDRLLDGGPASIITRIDGLVLLSFFTIFLYYSVSIASDVAGISEQVPIVSHALPKSLLFIVIGLAGLILGGNWIVKGATAIGRQLGMSESLVGLTIVAVGTSLPELATSALAARKGNVEIAVGNIVGSNIFNIFFVLGVSAIINPLAFMATGNLDLVAVMLASTLLFLFMFTGKHRRLDRWEAAVFILLYALYIGFSIVKR